jgi:hypothetical protein
MQRAIAAGLHSRPAVSSSKRTKSSSQVFRVFRDEVTTIRRETPKGVWVVVTSSGRCEEIDLAEI